MTAEVPRLRRDWGPGVGFRRGVRITPLLASPGRGFRKGVGGTGSARGASGEAPTPKASGQSFHDRLVDLDQRVGIALAVENALGLAPDPQRQLDQPLAELLRQAVVLGGELSHEV